MSLKVPKNLKKMFRKFPASNAYAAIFKNTDFSWSSKSYEIKLLDFFYLKFFSISIIKKMTFIVKVLNLIK